MRSIYPLNTKLCQACQAAKRLGILATWRLVPWHLGFAKSQVLGLLGAMRSLRWGTFITRSCCRCCVVGGLGWGYESRSWWCSSRRLCRRLASKSPSDATLRIYTGTQRRISVLPNVA